MLKSEDLNDRGPDWWLIAVVVIGLLTLLFVHPAHAQTGSATLSWNPPTKNTDGSSLTNLAATKVYWGSSPTALSSSTTLNNPSASSYVVSPLTAGTWYFAVTALNSAGAESARSNVASKTIVGTPPTSVTIGGPVFSIQPSDSASNPIVFPSVGNIAAGKSCDSAFGAIVAGKTYLHVKLVDAVLTPGVDATGLALYAACQ